MYFLPAFITNLRPLICICYPAMRESFKLCATATAAGSTLGLKPAPLALLPPIPLYRRLLRTHRKFLPKKLRLLGDEYIKHEFRRHQKAENPMHIVSFFGFSFLHYMRITHKFFQIGFLTEWQMYAQKIEGDSWRGEKLDKGKIDKMSGKYAS